MGDCTQPDCDEEGLRLVVAPIIKIRQVNGLKGYNQLSNNTSEPNSHHISPGLSHTLYTMKYTANLVTVSPSKKIVQF